MNKQKKDETCGITLGDSDYWSRIHSSPNAKADVQTFCRIFDRLSKKGISDPAELYRKGILEYLKIYE